MSRRIICVFAMLSTSVCRADETTGSVQQALSVTNLVQEGKKVFREIERSEVDGR